MIRFVELTKSFGERRVLDAFSLDVPEGKTTVLLGASGSGKSVALKHIVGLLEPDAGHVEVDGRVVHELDRSALAELRASIGFVFQFAALFDSMTVEENVRLGLARRGMTEQAIADRVTESLRLVELEDTRTRNPAELSGGQRKRVGIARAIAPRPRYILWDEPTTGLDPITSAVMDELMIRARQESGATSLVVTHDLLSAYRVGDRLALLFHGAVRQAGTVAEIRGSRDPIVREFIEGRPDRPEAEEAAVSEGIK